MPKTTGERRRTTAHTHTHTHTHTQGCSEYQDTRKSEYPLIGNFYINYGTSMQWNTAQALNTGRLDL